MSGNRASGTAAAALQHVLAALLITVLVAICYHLVDRPAAIWARGLGPEIVAVFTWITVLGSSALYLPVLAALYPVLGVLLRRPAAARQALFVVAAIIVPGVTVNLLKAIVARWRPIALFAEPPRYGFTFFTIGHPHNSFPSGHATTALAVACALALLFPRLRLVWLAAAAVVASSRVIIGAHYPGDVVAGAWFGAVITIALGRTVWFRDVIATPRDGSGRGRPAFARRFVVRPSGGV